MDSFYGIPNEPIQYYDRKEKTCYYCKECNEILPLTRKEIGLCESCEEILDSPEVKEAKEKVRKEKALKARMDFIKDKD